jgi:hypothetical protein
MRLVLLRWWSTSSSPFIGSLYSIPNADVLEISACSHCDGVVIAQSLIARSHKKIMGHSDVKHHSRQDFANSIGAIPERFKGIASLIEQSAIRSSFHAERDRG